MYLKNKKEPNQTSKDRKKEENRKKLEAIVSKITPENRHKEINWGKPIGKEVW
ncbi:hypothetical protein [Persephonella sp.]|uniref:AbrB/MazE/SpoVT family DNA-binding domain-containing protein n=1 Tax=Persephonella sp. TaxID=2060922 RepID=UPI0025FC9572|nr:hypothetical protein [Persephonella sp.]